MPKLGTVNFTNLPERSGTKAAKAILGEIPSKLIFVNKTSNGSFLPNPPILFRKDKGNLMPSGVLSAMIWSKAFSFNWLIATLRAFATVVMALFGNNALLICEKATPAFTLPSALMERLSPKLTFTVVPK